MRRRSGHPALIKALLFGVLQMGLLAASAIAAPSRIFVELDFQNQAIASASVLAGVELAIDEYDHALDPWLPQLVSLDNRGNMRRLFHHLDMAGEDKNILAVVTGSLPVPPLTLRGFARKNGVPVILIRSNAHFDLSATLVAPVFRMSNGPGDRFRFLIHHLNEEATCKETAILTSASNWAVSETLRMQRQIREDMRGAVEARDLKVIHFRANPGKMDFLTSVVELNDMNADCAIFVGKPSELHNLTELLSEIDRDLDVFTHLEVQNFGMGQHPERQNQLVQTVAPVPSTTGQNTKVPTPAGTGKAKVTVTMVHAHCDETSRFNRFESAHQVAVNALRQSDPDLFRPNGSPRAPDALLQGVAIGRVIAEALLDTEPQADMSSSRAAFTEALIAEEEHKNRRNAPEFDPDDADLCFAHLGAEGQLVGYSHRHTHNGHAAP